MKDQNRQFQELCTRKAFELSYALFRVAAYIQKRGFADQLEEEAVAVLTLSTSGNYEELRKSLNTILYLVSLGENVNLISGKNSETLMNELRLLNSAIAEFENSATLPDYELEPLFSEWGTMKSKIDARKGGDIIKQPIIPKLEQMKKEERKDDEDQGDLQPAGSEIRQSAITERIRQIGNLPDGKAGCRLKDIHDIFPDLSERTIRYDVQNLIEKGVIERMGGGGPGTYYQLSLLPAGPRTIPEL